MLADLILPNFKMAGVYLKMKVVIYKDYFAEDKLSFVPNYL